MPETGCYRRALILNSFLHFPVIDHAHLLQLPIQLMLLAFVLCHQTKAWRKRNYVTPNYAMLQRRQRHQCLKGESCGRHTLNREFNFFTTKDPVKITYKTSVYAPVPVLCLGKADTKSRTDGERPSTGPDLIVQRAFRDN